MPFLGIKWVKVRLTFSEDRDHYIFFVWLLAVAKIVQIFFFYTAQEYEVKDMKDEVEKEYSENSLKVYELMKECIFFLTLLWVERIFLFYYFFFSCRG